MSTYKEYVLSTNNLQLPKEYDDEKAIGLLLYHLIMLNPGDNTLYPEMGVGLTTKWRYMKKDDLSSLSSCIKKQIQLYLPQLQAVNVELKTNNVNNSLTIGISTDDTMYSFDTNELETPITLSDFN